MVVSEADLNRLDYYITAKERLHNRFLFGTGVVCGLVVTCHPCGGGLVNVSGGYALGPCGEDIVVCADDTVDVCALVKKCRSLEQREVECRPWGDTRGCDEVQEEWILAIRYDEQPSRNAPMLKAGSAGDCGCACGSGHGCSCSGGGSCACGGGASCSCGGSTGSRQPRREIPLACAPTVVCETYRYEVFRAPPGPRCDDEREQLPPGRLLERIQKCAGALVALLTDQPAQPLNDDMPPAARQAWVRYCQRIKSSLYEHLTRERTSRCDLLQQLCRLSCPDATLTGGAFEAAMQQALLAVWPSWLAAIQDCLCFALLPPCPAPAHDPRLPLAVVTVTGGECAIVELCNWTPLRPLVGTFPNVGYWLSAFGLIEQLRRTFFCFCCEPLIQQRRPGVVEQPPGNVPIFGLAPMFRPGAAPGPAPDEADPLRRIGLDLDQLGIVGKWLGTMRPEPRDLVAGLGLAVDPKEVESLERRLAALEAEVARLRGGPG
jgi:hypothetical protein